MMWPNTPRSGPQVAPYDEALRHAFGVNRWELVLSTSGARADFHRTDCPIENHEKEKVNFNLFHLVSRKFD